MQPQAVVLVIPVYLDKSFARINGLALGRGGKIIGRGFQVEGIPGFQVVIQHHHAFDCCR